MEEIATEAKLAAPPAFLGRRGMQFLMLVIATSTVALASRAVSPLQEAMRTSLALTDVQMSLLQGPALWLPMVVLAIPLGFLIDRVSRVRLLLVLAMLNTIGCFLTAWGASFAELLIARALVGVTATGLTITGFSLLADLYAPEQRGRAKAAIGVGQQVATSVAFGAGGTLLALFGLQDGWHWAMFWLTCPLSAVVTLLMLFMREPPRSGRVLQRPSSRQTVREIWQCRAVIGPLLGAIFLTEISIFAVLTWAAPTLSRGFGLTADRVGGIMAMVTVIGGLSGPIIGGVLADVCQRTGGPRRTLAGLRSLALAGVCGGLFAVAPGLASATTLLTVFNLIVSATVSMGTTLFVIIVPNELRGVCLSLLAAAVSFGAALGPVVVGALSSASGDPSKIGGSLSVVCIAASVLGALMFTLTRRRLAGNEQTL